MKRIRTMNSTAAQAYKIKMDIKALEIKYNALMDTLKKSEQTEFGPYRLTITQRPGAVDYSSIPELKSVNLEQFRKPSVSVYKLEYMGE